MANLPPSTRLQVNALRALRNPTANVTAEALDAIQASLDRTRRDLAALEAAASTVVSSSTTTAYLPCSATTITNAQFILDPVTSDRLEYALNHLGTYTWGYYELDFRQPTAAADRNYWFSFVTWQKGYMDGGGAWHPAPDAEGQDDNPAIYHGRYLCDTSAIQGDGSTPATTVKLRGDFPPDWSFPPVKNVDGSTNLYRTFRFWNYAVSLMTQDPQNAAGGITLETCWQGGADHFDLTPAAQPPALDLGQANPATLGPGVTITDHSLQVKNGVGIDFDDDGNVHVKTADGVTIDGSGNVTIAPGNGIAIVGGQVVVNAASGLAVGASGVYVPLGGVVDAMIAGVGATKLTAGTLAAGVVYAGTVAANQILAGTLGVGVVYAGTINVSQLNAGTLGVGIVYAGAIDAAQINVGTLNGIKITVTVGGCALAIDPADPSAPFRLTSPGSYVTTGLGGSFTMTGPSGYAATYSITQTRIQATASTYIQLNVSAVSGASIAMNDGVTQALLTPEGLSIYNQAVVGQRQTGPGTATSSVGDAALVAWCNNLASALRTHGLIT